LAESWESGSDEAQYTALNFRVTDRGRLALLSVPEPTTAERASSL
jgi:hypothetical protein